MVMQTFNMHEAKTHLSRLVERAEHGEEILIARSGKPVAKLVPIDAAEISPREPGSMQGLIIMREDFDDPLPDEILDAFEGRA